MNRDYFKDIYTDFFDNKEIPRIEVKEKVKKELTEELESLFKEIDSLYIEVDSKNLLKKIINYMSKYKSKEESIYIPFRIVLEVNNNTLRDKISNIIFEGATYFEYITNKKIELSLYKLDKNFKFDDYGFTLFHSLNGINLEEDKVSKEFFYDLKEFLKKDEKSITILSGNKTDINGFFLGHEELHNNYFIFNIVGINPDIQDIYNNILEKTSLEDDKKVLLLDYITNTYNKELDYVHYENDLVKYISFNKDIPVLKEEKSIEEVFKDLNELVGLKKVKKVLYDLVDVIKLKEKAGDTLKIKDINLHMVFLGNPGTGKTTIARLIAEILYNLKYIKENKLVEVSVKDLVAEYVGQTAPKTMSVIEKAMNGVLFIDEAYTLASTRDNSYNDEAIATLIQAMENYRDKLVVIFAGYTNEMQRFLDSNSGITSRIGYTLEFDDYTTDELIEIFKGMTKKAGFIVKDDAISYLREIIDKYRNMKNFGNARFIRNIYEKTVIKHASNVKDKKRADILKTITKDDISVENLSYEIPEYFKISYSSNNYKTYRYEENSVYCNISITTRDYYDDALEAIKATNVKISDNVSEIKEIDLNGNSAYALEVESTDNLEKTYYYMLKIKNHIYSIEYEIRDYEKGDRTDGDTNKCFSAREEFVNSIMIK